MRVSTATLIASLASSALAAGACAPLQNFKMTFYGFPDNDPPGPQVRYTCGGRGGKASGVGTYDNPLTMATEHGRFAQCEIVYSPYLQKYLRNEDSCANCSGDWVDVWLGSTTTDGGSSLLSCQNTLTGTDKATRAIVQNPPNNLPVSSAELYSGSCNTNLVQAAADKLATCVGTGSGPVAVPSGVAAPLPAASAVKSRLNGAKMMSYLMANGQSD